MALPKMNEEVNFVKNNLPSGKAIGARGWKVKDEKELLFALESEEDAEANKIKYIISFLKNCVDDTAKFNVLSEQDIKKVCVEIRKLSKGETIEYNYKCPKCNMSLQDEVNLTDNLVVKKFDMSPVPVNNDLIITFGDLSYNKSMDLMKKYGSSDAKYTYYYIINSIVGITYKDTTYTSFTEDEVITFLDPLDPLDMEKIYKSFNSKISDVSLSRTIKCIKCKEDIKIDFGDLLSFLVL
jgi:hypothetical protein